MMSIGRNLRWSSYLIMIGCVQFIILSTIAMFFYQGGTYIDSSTISYVFWGNYFSDLGRIVAHSGVSNTVSFILFLIALSLLGITQIPFYISFPRFFKTSKRLKRLSIMGSIFGIINSILYVGIAFTPTDVISFLHEIFVVIAFSSIFFSYMVYSLVIYKDKNYPNFFALILCVSAVIIGVYAISIVLAQSITTPVGLFIHVFGQKIMIYTILLCGIIQGYGALKHLAS